MKLYTTKEIVSLLGISERNLKFWIKEYKIKPQKKGKNNYFDEIQFEQLKIINYFSQNNYFTGKLLAIYLNEIRKINEEIEKEKEKLKKFIKGLEEIEEKLNRRNILLSLLSDEIEIKEIGKEDEKRDTNMQRKTLNVELL